MTESASQRIEAAPARPRVLARARRRALATILLIVLSGTSASWGATIVVSRQVLERTSNRDADRRLDRAIAAAEATPGVSSADLIHHSGRVVVQDGRVQGTTGADPTPLERAILAVVDTGAAADRDVVVGGQDLRARLVPTPAGPSTTEVLVGLTTRPPDPFGALVVGVTVVHGIVLAALALVAVLAARRSTHIVESVFRQEDRLLLAVAHEVRSPVSRLLTVVDEGLTGVLPGPDALREIADEGEEMSQLIDDLTEAARIMSGAVALPREVVRLDQLLGTVPRSAALGQATVIMRSEPVEMVGSERLLRLTVNNLIRNADRHAYQGGPGLILVLVDAIGLSVLDGGPGIPAAELREMRSYTALGLPRASTGLGLALAAWVAELHGGHLELTNRPEGGFAARLHLPVRPVPGEEAEAEWAPR